MHYSRQSSQRNTPGSTLTHRHTLPHSPSGSREAQSPHGLAETEQRFRAHRRVHRSRDPKRNTHSATARSDTGSVSYGRPDVPQLNATRGASAGASLSQPHRGSPLRRVAPHGMHLLTVHKTTTQRTAQSSSLGSIGPRKTTAPWRAIDPHGAVGFARHDSDETFKAGAIPPYTHRGAYTCSVRRKPEG